MRTGIVLVLLVDVLFAGYVVSRLFAPAPTFPISAERLFR